MDKELFNRLAELRIADFNARHGAAVFLTLYALVGLFNFSIEDKQLQQRVTAAWVVWGVTFILLGFFIISPEQDALQLQRVMTAIDKAAKI